MKGIKMAQANFRQDQDIGPDLDTCGRKQRLNHHNAVKAEGQNHAANA